MNQPIAVTSEQFNIFAQSLRRPDRAYMERRDELFARMDENIDITYNGMDMEVKIRDLDLSFMEGKVKTC